MWSFKIGRLFGINIRIHFLFILFLLLLGISYGLVAVFFLTLVFGCVLLHELGHCLVARHYHIPVRDIMLWPLGGIANMERMPQNPKIEMHIAAAGPLVNLVIALLLCPIALIFHLSLGSSFFTHLIAANIVLMIFNLIPAFPMDGGRIFRAWQARKLGLLEATRLAVRVGGFTALAMGIFGLLTGHLGLALIALFVYFAGKEELALVEAQGDGDWFGRTVVYPRDRVYHFYSDPRRSGRFHPTQEEWEAMMRDMRNFFHRRH